MIASLLAALRALPLLGRIGLAGVGVLGVGGAYLYWHHQVYEAGYDAAIEDVKKENANAAKAAERARARVRGCDVDGGMRWSQARGQCVRGE